MIEYFMEKVALNKEKLLKMESPELRDIFVNAHKKANKAAIRGNLKASRILRDTAYTAGNVAVSRSPMTYKPHGVWDYPLVKLHELPEASRKNWVLHPDVLRKLMKK